HRIRGNGRMGDHDVPRPKSRGHLPDDIEQSVIVRDKNLDVIAHFGELGRGPDKVWDRTRIAIPHEDVKPTFTQIFSDPASNDTESKHPNVFPGSTRHVKAGLILYQAAHSACGEN